jgi:predicted nucleic acid-binding protein
VRDFVPDASVAVKWVLDEDQSAAADDLLVTGRSIYAPALLRVEVAAAITRQHRLKSLRDEEVRERLSLAAFRLSRPVVQLVDDGALLERAGVIALQIRHPLQDCLYVACAELCEADLITADRALHRRASVSFDFVKLL